jgi:hypothetical protein
MFSGLVNSLDMGSPGKPQVNLDSQVFHTLFKLYLWVPLILESLGMSRSFVRKMASVLDYLGHLLPHIQKYIDSGSHTNNNINETFFFLNKNQIY